ncbi:MAG TPA: sigma-70 family RNA polymerase sigma factor [Pyrinomonadaceae bacterium]|nr:sigma-70 family RNA polymerase sigma factor [Pyrinomonadaceae bacterium]
MGQRAIMEPRIIDERVIDDCRQGDREAFRLLFEAYRDRVFSIAVYSFRGDEAAASDITQQVFLKLMTTIGQFRGDAEFTTWLYRLVVNACTDEQRRRRRFFPLGESMAMTRVADRRPQEKHYARVELAESVKVAISELKPKFRQPILLKYIEGLSYGEIAKVLGCSMGTVASRLNRGHKTLAKRLAHLRGQVVLGD